MTTKPIEPFPCELLDFWIQELRCRSTEAEGTFEAPVTTHPGDKGALLGWVNSAKTHQKTSEMVRNRMAERFLKSSEKKVTKIPAFDCQPSAKTSRLIWPNYFISPT